MKIPAKAIKALWTAITPLDTDDRRDRYIRGDIPRADAVKDLNKRYRWDLFWEVRGHNIVGNAMGAQLFSETLDSHIDTALRRIVPALLEGE